ncbi:MAG: dolichyl-phosphate-mannose--protein mannosyltransferase [Propionibacteriaceae bacterium]
MPLDAVKAWIIAAALTALAFVMRLLHLGRTNTLMFDETYYAKDAWALLHGGYEREWGSDANDKILQGIVELPEKASFIVHPPVGKWLIAAGEALFGFNSFGWRISACVLGSLMIGLVVLLARRLTRSTLIGAIAGLLLTFDGLHFTMSRIALLDIFQAFFLVLSVLLMLNDRDWFRDRLAAHLESQKLADLGGSFGPTLLWRPWRLAAGIVFGLAIGTKWNSAMLLAVMCVLTLWWDLSARRLAGAGKAAWSGIIRDGVPAFIWQVVIAFITYVATWSGWLLSADGWDRQWGLQNPDNIWVKLLGSPLGSLVHYHKEISDFHNGDFIKSATHVYEAHPAGWLVMARTIGIDAVNDIQPGTDGCPSGGDTCMRVINGMGTPLLWWAAAAALIAAIFFWIAHRDWRFSLPVCAALATYLPWFNFTERPLFFFYAITIIPFTTIGLAMVLGKILGPAPSDSEYDPQRRQKGAIIVGLLIALIILNFAFIYPVLTDALMTRGQWSLRMWFAGWI